jgi:alkaline phosphatase D
VYNNIKNRGVVGMKFKFLWIAAFIVSFNASAQDIVKIVAGSCMKQSLPKPALASMAAENPNLTLLMGDNVYADTVVPDEMRAVYTTLVKDPNFIALKAKAPLMATWDDHDFSTNDSDGTNPIKNESKKLFLEFLGEGQQDSRQAHDGIYTSMTLGSGRKKVHVIMLDTRFNLATKSGRNPPPETVKSKPGQKILGETQWKWFEDQLNVDSAFKIVVSSVQVFSNFHKYERWSVLPDELNRLKTLLSAQKGAGKNIIFLSGDRHFGEIAKYAVGSDSYYEMTSSNLNLEGISDWPKENNPQAIAKLSGPQYGVLDLKWGSNTVQVSLKLKDARGDTKATQPVDFRY